MSTRNHFFLTAVATLCAAAFAAPVSASMLTIGVGGTLTDELPADPGVVSVSPGAGVDLTSPGVIQLLEPQRETLQLANGRIVVLRAESDYSLWNLVQTVQAQQQGEVFTLVGAAARDAEVSPVPLPAAAWLLAAGVAGLAGTRRRKQGDAATAAAA